MCRDYVTRKKSISYNCEVIFKNSFEANRCPVLSICFIFFTAWFEQRTENGSIFYSSKNNLKLIEEYSYAEKKKKKKTRVVWRDGDTVYLDADR